MSHERPPDPAATLSRQQGVALWREIAEHLRAEIAAGTPAAGARLPSEAELARRFGVNRHTLRRALEELARAGLVRIAQGRGSFVSEDVLDYTVGPRTRFSEWIRRHNKEPSGQVLRLAESPPSRRSRAGSASRQVRAVILLERLGFADDRAGQSGARIISRRRSAPACWRRCAPPPASPRRWRGRHRRLPPRGHPRHRAAAHAGGSRAAAHAAQPPAAGDGEHQRRRARGGWSSSAWRCYPTPRVQIVFEP